MDVTLRNVAEADLEVFFAQEHDEEATRRSKFVPREHDKFMAHWKANVLGDPDVFVQAILADGALAGNAVAWTEDDGRRILGYWLARMRAGGAVAISTPGASTALDRPRPPDQLRYAVDAIRRDGDGFCRRPVRARSTAASSGAAASAPSPCASSSRRRRRARSTRIPSWRTSAR